MAERPGGKDPRDGKKDPPDTGVPRRSFLAAGGALIVAAVGGAGAWLTARSSSRVQRPAGSARPESIVPSSATGVFPVSGHPLLLALAEAIVPRHGPHPGAGEIDLLPRLERCVSLGAQGSEFYSRYWKSFERALRKRVSFDGDRPDPTELDAVMSSWYREAREQSSPSLPASYFEGLRGYVLLAYYTSPEGWRSVGYSGPVHRSHPLGGGARG